VQAKQDNHAVLEVVARLTDTGGCMKRLSICLATIALAACGGGGGGSTPVAVTPVGPAPTITLSSNTSSFLLGGSATLTWSTTDATSCTASGAWTGTQATTGNATLTPTTAENITYTLQCTGAGGNASKSVDVSVKPVAINHTYAYAATPPVPQPTLNGYPMPAAGAVVSTHFIGMWEVADLRGIGRDDVIFVPTFAPQYMPKQPLEIWLNNGDGTWDVDGANKLIVGGAPKLNTSAVRVGDLNGDGKLDMLFYGNVELGECGSPADANHALCYGGDLVYLESQPDGKYIDASSKFASFSIATINLQIGSLNGDGANDLLVVQDGSLRLFKNDGHANFTEQTDKLPLEIRYIADPLKNGTRWAATNGVAQQFGNANLVKLRANSKPVIVTGSYGWDWGTEAPGTAKFSNGTDSLRFFEQDANGNYVRTAMIVEDKARGDACGINAIMPIQVSNVAGREEVFINWEPTTANTPSTAILCSPTIYTSTVNTDTTSLNVTEMINMINPADVTINLGGTELTFPNPGRTVDFNNDGWIDIEMRQIATIDNLANGYATRLYNNRGTSFGIKPLVIGGVTQTGSTLAALTGTDTTSRVMAMPIKYGSNQYGLLLMEGMNLADAVLDPVTGYYGWTTMRLHSILKVE
jgi:hypothetical protein